MTRHETQRGNIDGIAALWGIPADDLRAYPYVVAYCIAWGFPNDRTARRAAQARAKSAPPNALFEGMPGLWITMTNASEKTARKVRQVLDCFGLPDPENSLPAPADAETAPDGGATSPMPTPAFNQYVTRRPANRLSTGLDLVHETCGEVLTSIEVGESLADFNGFAAAHTCPPADGRTQPA